jgi:hypothetical protein
LLLRLVVVWLALSVLAAVVACAMCRSGHAEDAHLGYDA